MKKLLIAFCILGLLASPALAKRIVIQENLRDASTNSVVSNLQLWGAVDLTTSSVYIGRSVGTTAALLINNDVNALQVNYQVSADDQTWYTVPYERTSATVTTPMNTLVTTTTALSSTWVQFTIPLAEKMRFRMLSAADCHVTASLIYQIEQ